MSSSTIRDLHDLPRFRDGWTFLYVDKAVVDKDKHALSIRDAKGRVAAPIAALSVLLLGPGVSITHAAVAAAAESGVSVVWCGEGATRFYAAGAAEPRRARNLLHQATVWASEATRLQVVKRMYRMRFDEALDDDLTIAQIRGKEGVRVREGYAAASRATGIEWVGRNYKVGEWSAADPVNRALSAANACLYGLCHSAIVATGFSPGLGFVHTGKLLAFVYDIADLYKLDVTVPAAFHAVRIGGSHDVSSRVRRLCRASFHRHKLLERIVPDLQRALGLKPEAARFVSARESDDDDLDEAHQIASLWDPDEGSVRGGSNFGPLLDTPPLPDFDDEVPF